MLNHHIAYDYIYNSNYNYSDRNNSNLHTLAKVVEKVQTQMNILLQIHILDSNQLVGKLNIRE